jgi:putative addiction module killer protein
MSEPRIHYGLGNRVYYTARGENLVVLPAGGDKRSQPRDIAKAIELARDIED